MAFIKAEGHVKKNIATRIKEVTIVLHSMFIQEQLEHYAYFQEPRSQGSLAHQGYHPGERIRKHGLWETLQWTEIFPKEDIAWETQSLTSSIWRTVHTSCCLRGQTSLAKILCPEISSVHFAVPIGLFLSRSLSLKDRELRLGNASIKHSRKRLTLELYVTI